jgi:hypothetical protein
MDEYIDSLFEDKVECKMNDDDDGDEDIDALVEGCEEDDEDAFVNDLIEGFEVSTSMSLSSTSIDSSSTCMVAEIFEKEFAKAQAEWNVRERARVQAQLILAQGPSQVCNTCGIRKPMAGFHPRYDRPGKFKNRCKSCSSAANISPAEREARLASMRIYQKTHAEQIRAYTLRYRPINTARTLERRAEDMSYRLTGNIQGRMSSALRGGRKFGTTIGLLGCSIEYFMAWLESQFVGELSWNNYAELWNVDHVSPCTSFDLTKRKQQEECFSWKNQRPLNKVENHLKFDTIDPVLIRQHRERVAAWLAAHPIQN